MSNRIAIYSDLPPLGEEGTNMPLLSHRVIRSVEDRVVVVVTRRAARKYERALIGSALSVDVQLSWDCVGCGLRFIKGVWRRRVDLLLLKLWAFFHARPEGLEDGDELICLAGPHWGVLQRMAALAKVWRLKYSVYVTDDFELTARHWHAKTEQAKCHKMLTRYLMSCHRVWAISPGMAKRFEDEYNVRAGLIYPIADEAFEPNAAPHQLGQPLRIVYVGSLGPVYIDELVEVASVIDELDPLWQFRVISRDARTFGSKLSPFKSTTGLHECDRQGLQQEVAQADAILIPCTFNPEWKEITETFFPSKFTDAVGAGKPILLYSPPYTSIACHLRDAGLKLSAGSKSELAELLKSRIWEEDTSWRACYDQLLEKYHSSASARKAIMAS